MAWRVALTLSPCCPKLAAKHHVVNWLRVLSQRMQVAHQALESFLQHMRVDLRGRDVGMTEQRLHHAQVGAVLQQMAGKSMAQHMRADLCGLEPGAGSERLQLTGKMLPGEMTALAERREQPFRFRGL